MVSEDEHVTQWMVDDSVGKTGEKVAQSRDWITAIHVLSDRLGYCLYCTFP